MMVLKIHFTPDEVADFFRANGFTVENRKFGHWVHVYHNKSDWVETYENAVILPDGSFVAAAPLFEKVVQYRMKRMIAPINLEIKRTVEREFKTLLKNK